MAKQKKFQLPPKKEVKPEEKKPSVKDKKLQAFIKKGGAPAPAPGVNGAAQPIKNFNIKMLASYLENINKAREVYPKTNVGQKTPGITINNWILEAIEEKLAR